MTIGQAFIRYRKVEIDLLLAFVLKKSKEFLFMHPKYKLSSLEAASLARLVKRREKGKPIAYILGRKEFCSLGFLVNKNVLIPRPETEWVVEKIVSKVKAQKRKLKILDVGTGSGCIAISVAKNLGDRALVFASDISKKALVVAKKNARMHRAGVKFIESDLLAKIEFIPEILVANLPYGWSEWKNNSSAQTTGLKFEPNKALFAKEHGLSEIRRLLEALAKLEERPQSIFLEFDPRQKNELDILAKKNLPNFRRIFYKDYSKLWRYLELVQEKPTF